MQWNEGPTRSRLPFSQVREIYACRQAGREGASGEGVIEGSGEEIIGGARPPGDRQTMECRARHDMKGEKPECQCHRLLFLWKDTLRRHVAIAWPGGQAAA